MAGPNDVILNVGAQLSPDTESKLQQSFARIEKNMKFNTPFAAGSRNVRDFSSELDRANQRVITLGASFAVLSSSIRVFKDIITSTIAVEKALTDINSVFQLSTKSLEQFSRGLFNVARETSQSFEKTAEAAKEFSRQGLGATEVLKRTRDAMVLTRLASLDAEEAVSTLTASINGFQKAALDSTQIVNKLATVDAAFAVSSKDLAQGLARAGAAASDAGVSFDQLIGLITSAQQTTARGGAVIGNSLKTIFTRVERKDTIEAFEALGVAVADTSGNLYPAIKLLQNFANVYDKLGGTVKKQAAELVGGVYQINILKALLSDLSKGSSSVAERAANTSAKAADEAIKRNEALNKSLAALLQQSQTTYQQIGSKVGDIGVSGAAKNLLTTFNTSSFVQAFANAGDTDANSAGEKMAAGFIKGFGNAVVFGLGPTLLFALGKITTSVFGKIQRDFADIIGANNVSKQQAVIQNQIVSLYEAGDTALKRQLLTMGSLAERAAMVESILAKGAQRQAAVASELGALSGAVLTIRKTPRAAGGYDPFSAEASAIRAGVGGASPGAKPVMIKNFAYGGGVSGPIVANTSEWMVKTGAGSAIYNPAMIQKMGLPPGATPIAAGGYIPNMAKGGNPYGLPPEWSSPDYYKSLGQPPEQYGPAAPTDDQWAEMNQEKTRFYKEVFAKSKAEEFKRQAVEAKMAELKQRQLEEMAKQLDGQKRATGLSSAELKAIEKGNEKLRRLENERYAAAGLAAIQAKQAMEAKFPSHNASPETMAAFLSARAASAGSGASYNAWLAARANAANPPPPPAKYVPPFLERTFPEQYFKRDFQNLTLKDLSYSSSLPMPWVNGPSTDRTKESQMARGFASRNVVGASGVNYVQLNNSLRASRGLAGGSTIEEQFNTTVQDLLKSGKGMNTAYNAAIAEIMKETTNRAQINRIIRESIPVNVAFEKAMAESLEATMMKNKQSRVAVNLQATQNQIGATLGSGGFGALDPRQRAIYLATIRREEAQKLGFKNANVGGNELAQSQINQAVSQRVAQIFQTIPDTLKVPEKASILSRIGSKFTQNPLLASLGASIGLSFAGGAVPSMFSQSDQRGGTTSGMAIGGLSSGLSLAGTGAGLGSFFGPAGIGIGAGVGAAIGGISGVIGKMTKSFEELAEEINNANAKIRAQFDNASEVARLQNQITELLSGDQSEEEIQRAARRIRSKISSGLSKVDNPRVKALLESGDPKSMEEAMALINDRGSEKAQAGDIMSAVRGALDTSVGSMGGAFGYGKDAPERISNALAPLFAGKSGVELAGISRSAQKDPRGTIRKIMLEAGVSAGMKEEDIRKSIEEFMPNLRLNLAAFDGYEETNNLFQSGIGKAISGAAIDKNRRPEVIKRQENRAKRLSDLRAISERYKSQSEFSQIRSSSDLQIAGVEQQIAASSPLLLDTDRLRQQGAFGLRNIRAQSAGAREAQLLAGKSTLTQTLEKGGDSDQIRKLIDGLSSLGDVKRLIETISSSQGIMAAGISGAGTTEFKKALLDLQRTMEKLDESESEQTRVTTVTNRLLSEQLAFTKTYAGARAEYGGAAKSAGVNLMTSLRRFDTPDILLKNIGESNLANLNDEYNRSGGKMSRYEYQGRRMGIGANAEAAQKLSSGAGVRYLLNNPNAMGAKDLTGSQVTSGLMAEAEATGMSGKSLKSMADGFKAVFAGMKKDMTDLSKLGANLAQSLSSGLGNAFGDFVTGAKSAKDAFRSFAISALGDASRMFASQAIQGILGSIFGGISPTISGGIGKSNGGAIGFAMGGKVPAMLTGGEYYVGPNAAKKIGYDTLHRLNKFAEGGMVQGGSGVKDDVPAKLPPGSFILKKSAVGKLGPDYLDSLVNGKVQHRFFGGMLMGALLGGGIGYATGGKKGAIAGAILGGIGGGLAQNYSQTGSMFKSDPNAGMFQFSSSVGNVPAGYEVGVGAPAAAAKPPMPMWQKAAWGLGAAALLGGVSKMLIPKDPKFTPWTSAQITENRKKMEAEQSGMSAPAGLYPWLSPNPNGGSNMMGYVLPPTRRMYANGGAVGMSSPLFMSEGGAVGVTGSVDSGVMTPASSSRSGGAASNVNVTIEINNNGSTSSSVSSDNKDSQGGFGAEFAQKLQKQVQGIVQQELVNQSRSDGFFAQKNRFVQR